MFAFKSFLFENMLLEDKIDFISDKQGDKAWEAFGKDMGHGKPKETDGKGVIKTLSTWSEKNLQWLVNNYIKGKFSLEDKGRLMTILSDFDKYKKNLEKKDLNQYKDIAELEDKLSTFTEEDSKSKKQLSKEAEAKMFKDKEAKLFYEGGGIKVIIPKTEAVSCYFGRGTKWCTAATNHNMFEHYSKAGSLYIVFTDDGRKYQFYFKTGSQQMMDEEDKSIKNWSELTEKYPALITAFEAVAKKSGFLPLIKDPNDTEIIKAMKNETAGVVRNFNDDKKVLPKAAADYAVNVSKGLLSSYPHAFGKEYALELFKKGSYSYELNSWLHNMVGKVTKKDLTEIIESMIARKDYHDLENLIKMMFSDHKLSTAYGTYIDGLPESTKEEIVNLDRNGELIKHFEDDLSEKFKISMVDKDPDLIKHFGNITNKMKQAAQWAADRIKRKNRGY